MPDVYDDMSLAVREQDFATAQNQVVDLVPKGKTPQLPVKDLEALLIRGDIEQMTPDGRLAFYKQRCEDLGLSYISRPFDYIRIEDPAIKGTYKTILYANKNCAEQLRVNRHVSSEVIKTETEMNVFYVYVRASCPIIVDGKVVGTRNFDDIGAVNVAGLSGDKLANARMKAHTKAHRRATLGICGVGAMDETEVETVRGAIAVSPEELDKLSNRFNQGSVPTETTK